MTIAALDTNVLASGFARSNPEAAPTLLLDAWEAQAYTLLVSLPIIAELARTFRKPYFVRRITAAQAAADVILLQTQALLTPLTVEVHGARLKYGVWQLLQRVPGGGGDALKRRVLAFGLRVLLGVAAPPTPGPNPLPQGAYRYT